MALTIFMVGTTVCIILACGYVRCETRGSKDTAVNLALWTAWITLAFVIFFVVFGG